MPKRVTSIEARENFGDLINQVKYGKEQIIITRRGKPLVAIVPLEFLEKAKGKE